MHVRMLSGKFRFRSWMTKDTMYNDSLMFQAPGSPTLHCMIASVKFCALRRSYFFES